MLWIYNSSKKSVWGPQVGLFNPEARNFGSYPPAPAATAAHRAILFEWGFMGLGDRGLGVQGLYLGCRVWGVG